MKTALYTIAILSVAALVGVWTFNSVQAQASWYNSDWDYRQKITIDSSQVQSSLTDFPVYVDLATMSSGFFSNVQSDGGDIRVTQSDGTTEVAREVVSIDTASSTGELHFKADSVSSSTDTEFYIYYGNSGASNYTDSATYGAENVWTNSQASVYHLDEDSGDAVDSTSNNNDGTTYNGVTQGVGGQVGQAYDFDGSDDYVEIGSPPDPSGSGADASFAVTFWLYPNSDGSDNPIIEWSDGGKNDLHTWQFSSEGDFFLNPAGGCGTFGRNNDEIKLDQWSHYGVVYDKVATQFRLYRNGNQVDASSQDCNADTNSTELYFGHRAGDSRHLNGDLDNIRISDTPRSTDWIATTYTNQNSPTTFYTTGKQETETNSGKMTSDNYTIVRDSLNSGGLDQANSANYQVSDTVGQPATGRTDSANYAVQAGYRQMAEPNLAISTGGDIDLGSIGGVTGGGTEATQDVNVVTDNPAGYELTVKTATDPAMQNTTASGSFADYDAGTDPDFTFSVLASSSAFGFSPEGPDITSQYQDDGSSCNAGSQDTQSACWRGLQTTEQTVAKAVDNNQPDGATTTLRFRAESGADNVQTEGSYQATITVTGIAI